MNCRFCNNEVEIFLDLTHIPVSVTSDCRVINLGICVYKCKSCNLIQKKTTQNIQENYFSKFSSQFLSDGEEQVKFIKGKSYFRSELIINAISNFNNKNGTLLDIGTGSGVFLKSFKAIYPMWELYAQDIQDNSKDKILNIIDEKNFFCTDIGNIDKTFDLVSLIHVLGHIPNIDIFLDKLKKLIKKDGKILIQTPDICTGFFDVIIIDQITHFSKETLQNILDNIFHNSVIIEPFPIKKELTALINSNNGNKYKIKNDKYILNTIRDNFQYFIEFLYSNTQKYVVLGTGPASTYIGAILDNRLLYFVDEDILKIGKKHLGCDINSMDIIVNEKVILPFLDDNIINDIISRYKTIDFITYKNIR